MSTDTLANIQVCVGIASVILGVLLVVSPGTQLFSTYERSIAVAVSDTGVLIEQQNTLVHWLLATCGAGVIGWGITWIMISHIPLRRGELWSYRCLWISLSAWAVIDILIALHFGVTGEIVFVFFAFFAAAVPLFLGRRAFVSEK